MTGSSLFEGGSLRFVPGPVFTHILLVDEINRATPRTQAALLEAMQERQVSIEGVTRPLPDPFIVLATQNPVEFEGTFALPQAQLDRFLLRAGLGYPTEADERAIARRYQAHRRTAGDDRAGDRWARPDRPARRGPPGPGQRRGRGLPRRPGAGDARARGPGARRAARASTVALYRASQAAAVLAGRSFVLPDDVKGLVRPVLAHRLVVDLDRSLRGVSARLVLDGILERGARPRRSPPTEPRPG